MPANPSGTAKQVLERPRHGADAGAAAEQQRAVDIKEDETQSACSKWMSMARGPLFVHSDENPTRSSRHRSSNRGVTHALAHKKPVHSRIVMQEAKPVRRLEPRDESVWHAYDRLNSLRHIVWGRSGAGGWFVRQHLPAQCVRKSRVRGQRKDSQGPRSLPHVRDPRRMP